MNKEEIKQALEIIREPITVNCIDYHYFDNENYNKLISTYENCLWFVNNMEQIIEITNQLQERIENAIEYINNNGKKQYNHHDNYRGKWYNPDELDTILEILKGGKE